MIDLKLLIKNGVHFGHQTSRWHPKMEPYIWGYKNNIHLVDVSKTAHQLERAANFLKSVVADGKCIVWVGTKKAAQEVMQRVGKELNLPYVVHRWVGGTFSNYRQVRKSVANLLHYEDIIAKSELFPYGKKELNLFQKRADRLEKNVGGIRHLSWPVGAVVVVDVKKEHVCIKEALATGIPIVALVDTNSDPSLIDYVIPANDDAPRSIALLIEYLAEAVKQGQAVAAKPQGRVEGDVFESVLDGRVDLEEDESEEGAKRRQAAARAAKKPVAAAPKARTGRYVPAGNKKFVPHEDSGDKGAAPRARTAAPRSSGDDDKKSQ